MATATARPVPARAIAARCSRNDLSLAQISAGVGLQADHRCRSRDGDAPAQAQDLLNGVRGCLEAKATMVSTRSAAAASPERAVGGLSGARPVSRGPAASARPDHRPDPGPSQIDQLSCRHCPRRRILRSALNCFVPRINSCSKKIFFFDFDIAF